VSEIAGSVSKMAVSLAEESGLANYEMVLGEHRQKMNDFIGKAITLRFQGEINCHACNRLTKKSFSGGYCFPCSQNLAQCDLCIMRPETCHYAAGTCREPQWGEQFCMQDHIVYLANSSGIKVGITRITQVPTRWVDQGATQALPIFRVKSRLQSGLVEVVFKNHVSDRTDWRKMLKGEAEPLDLLEIRQTLMTACAEEITALQEKFGPGEITALDNEKILNIRYPIEQYPEKVKSLNFDKTPEINGVLQGIKGQYLILDTGVLNMRKFTGYYVSLGTV
jgi:hypothetical protein